MRQPPAPRERGAGTVVHDTAASPCVLSINAGSSSLKYSLYEAGQRRLITSGNIERIGEAESDVIQDGKAVSSPEARHVPDEEAALRMVARRLDESQLRGWRAQLMAVAHRVVHGGDRFTAPVVVDDGVLAAIRALAVLAPLHNPRNADGIEMMRRELPQVPQVAVFDTAFHHTLPAYARAYAVPAEWVTAHGVRRYGFHGTSCAYVSRRTAEILGRRLADTDMIVLHLGNGASASAIASGRSVDTSMGLTPSEGLVMGTRAGDVDAGLFAYLGRVAALGLDEIADALDEHGGLLALAGDNDWRALRPRIAEGDAVATAALDVYCYRIRKYVGAYLAALGGADAIVFTAGVGEHVPEVRAGSLAGLERLGVRVDDARNATLRGEGYISPDGADVAVLVVPTNEELEMATAAIELIRSRRV